MISFKRIGIEDREIITSYFYESEHRDCNLTFINLCSWQFLTDSHYAIVDDCLVARFSFNKGPMVYSMPVGKGDKRKVIEKLEEQACLDGHQLCITGIFPDLEDYMEKEFPGCFSFQKERNTFDYIYSRKELAELKGKYFQSKRNHVNKFKKLYDYEYTPLTSDMISKCLELEEKWCKEHDCSQFESLESESIALNFCLKKLDELNLFGGAIWVNGEIVAFTYGSPINYDTFCVHIEKADIHIEGAYNIINQEFAKHIPEQYIYLNREEDMGLPGLRNAKLSYRPVILLEKGYAGLKPGKHINKHCYETESRRSVAPML